MIKIVLAGVWGCLVTLVAVYFSVSLATAPAAPPEAANKPALDVLRGEPVTVPNLDNGQVTGYFLGRFSFLVDKQKAAGVPLPINELMTDELFTLLVGNKMVDLSKANHLDVTALRETIKTSINRRLGVDVVSDVLIEQLDYLGKEGVREGGGAPKLKPAVKIVEGQPAPEAAKPSH